MWALYAYTFIQDSGSIPLTSIYGGVLAFDWVMVLLVKRQQHQTYRAHLGYRSLRSVTDIGASSEASFLCISI
ncbi:hypothetical protein SynPROS91_01143 [Synechococcus sp. PROS-9-1]|nr:hypothetical protein SynPROS91_01143 [Synechococcus sp. PROS-9-1]